VIRLVYIVIESWWPHGKSEQVGKLYLEVMKKYPDDKTVSKPVIRSAVWSLQDGMHNIIISSVQPGKVKEALDLSNNRLLMMASSMEGYRFEVHIAYDLVEAMPLVGLKAPE